MDEDTLGFYDREAAEYAARQRPPLADRLDRFLHGLPERARVLELGCGGGQDAAYMLSRAVEVVPTDGSPQLAAEAAQRLGVPVRVMRFDELDAVAAYDGVWASASLLHVPRPDLAGVLRLVRTALKRGGRFWASYKAGAEEGRDRFGRYFNRLAAHDLLRHYEDAGPWQRLHLTEARAPGYDGEATDWLWAEAET